MSKSAVLDYLKSLIDVPAIKGKLVVSRFKHFELKKGEMLLAEGQVSRRAHLLVEGYIRSFVVDSEGEEVTTSIISPQAFANDFLSYFKGEPAKENFQAITDCKTYYIGYDDMQFAFHNMPEFREFGRMILTMNYERLHEQMLSMIKHSAEERYLSLLEKDPEIFQAVPLKIIASYLNITDTSLSRIRREVSKRGG
ncbi:MAG: Crp/Fnr family transcriptional regulator [Bacteroidota bacterium]